MFGHGIIVSAAAEGEIDSKAQRIVRRYDIADKRDEETIKNTVERIKNTLDSGRRININYVLVLYAAYAYHVLSDNMTTDAAKSSKKSSSMDNHDIFAESITHGVRTLLTRNQVMIGIPEMTANVSITIINNDSGRRALDITVHTPIAYTADARYTRHLQQNDSRCCAH